MKIGEIAREVQVSASILRHYEGKGLLPCPGRDSLGYREYTQIDLDRIRLVVNARQLGISLSDIKEILALHDNGKIPSPRILELLSDKAADVEQRSFQLTSAKLELCRLRDLALELQHPDLVQQASLKEVCPTP